VNLLDAASFVAAFSLSVLLTPTVRRICIRFGVFDQPGPLKIHAQPIPRLGGVAIALAILGACVIARPLPAGSAAYFVAALALVWIAGLVDDLRGLSPVFRIAAQASAALLLWRAGWQVPGLGTGASSILTTCLFVIVFANAINFLDGSDGLAAGVAGIIALAYIFARSGAGTQFPSGVAWSLFGACAGFLVFNFPLAKIFMGDSGSTSLGFMVSFLALAFCRSSGGTTPSLIFPLLIAGLPLLDAGLAVVRRLREAASPFYGDRRHFYDLLLARGWSPRKVALVSYSITAAMGAIGWIGLRLDSRRMLLLAALSFAALLAAALRLGSLRAERRVQRMKAQNAHTQS
jgi:UDP-N-acetylmuramyl pentapeptide phosphotransferase/UDP-N-acetylglucosamine-1-phosphate transferase